MSQPKSKKVGALEKRIKNLKFQNDYLTREMIVRGKALCKINKLVEAWKDLMPQNLYKALSPILADYVGRCSK